MCPPKSLRLAKKMHSQAWPGSHAITLKLEKKNLFPKKHMFYQKKVIAAREGEGAFGKQHKT